MGTLTKTYTEDHLGYGYTAVNRTLEFTGQDILVTDSTFNIGTITLKGSYSSSVNGRTAVYDRISSLNFIRTGSTIKQSSLNIEQSLAAGAQYTVSYGGFPSQTTSNWFKAANNTTRTVQLKAQAYNLQLYTGSYSGGTFTTAGYYAQTGTTFELGTILNVTLDVPPTATVSAISYDTASPYTDITTATVTVSNTTAYYGGTITDVTFTIGNQTDSISGDGTLSIALDTVGTFTPTVVVTDSRGQTYTETYSPITVKSYMPPAVNFTAERTTSAGVPDDEGTYATLDATFVFADVIATAIAPSVVMTDENGTQTTPTVTWYSSRAADGTLSGSVTWSSLSSGDTVYGLVPGLNTNYSYQISVRPRDSQGTGTAILQTVASAFYTIDFLAGGHGIAFGQPASTTGFVCNMTATFNNDADFGDDIFIELPEYQTSSTTDKVIYDAIVALGWDSDVLS